MTPTQSPFPSSPPPEAWGPLLRFSKRAKKPFERFLQTEASSGILLIAAAVLALLWANSPWADSYFGLWQTPLGIRVGPWSFERSLAWVVNDGLMVIFFFIVGLEIRREVHQGELSEWRRAALPAAAALGGMVAPAMFYLALVGEESARSGWGVPMATDIAFALGILTLLGPRVPAALRVLLLAIAVIDDLGAIIVIAVFYTPGVAMGGLLIAAAALVGIGALQRFGVRSKIIYVVPAVVAWAGVYAAGIHPTIAGVIVGLMTPVRAWLGPDGFLFKARHELSLLDQAPPEGRGAHEVAGILRQLEVAKREALSPVEALIERLHPWVAYGIMPLFALANAGVTLSAELGPASWGVSAAVGLALLVGKPLGILLACGLALKLRLGVLPAGVRLPHLVVLGLVAGIGFTMALFIAQLAFVDPGLLAAAKLGVMIASGVAAGLALVVGWWLLEPKVADGAALSADEAESSTEQ